MTRTFEEWEADYVLSIKEFQRIEEEILTEKYGHRHGWRRRLLRIRRASLTRRFFATPAHERAAFLEANPCE
jgi:hypothetical protein